MSYILDTLDFVRKAKDAGFTDKQAEFQAKELSILFKDEVATKRDLKELEQRMLIKLGSLMIVSSGVVIMTLGFIMKI